MSNKTFYEVAREYFPKEDKEALSGILFGFTGFPCFFAPKDGETVEDVFRQQLQEAKDGLTAGKIFDLEKGWIDREKKT